MFSYTNQDIFINEVFYMLKIATAAMQCERDKTKNLQKMLNLIDEASEQKADLLVLPEQALQGCLTSVVAMDASTDFSKNEFLYQYENAEIIPTGECVQQIIAKVMDKKMYVCFGMTERDADIDCKLYNSAVLVGPEGYIGHYRKVHQPADELHSYYAGDSFPVFDTPIGKIGMLICYDAWFPESGRELALAGAEIILKPTATCHGTVNHNLEEDQGYYSYDLCEKATALQNGCYFISANQVGICGQSDYFGHSNIINPSGRVLASTGEEEKIVYHEIEDLKKDIYIAREVMFSGLYFLKDRKPSVYKLLTTDNEFCNNRC